MVFQTGLQPNQELYLLLAVTGATVILMALYMLLRREERIPVGHLSELLIYPLKSAKAVSVDRAECQQMGLKDGELRDRHWMVVTEQGRMVIGTQEPRLVLVSLTFSSEGGGGGEGGGGEGGGGGGGRRGGGGGGGEEGQVCLNAPAMEELRLPLQQPDNPLLNCRVFGDGIQGRDCGDEAADWISSFLGGRKSLRLVHFEMHMKGRKSAVQEKLFPQHEEVAYAYAGPLLLLSEASVENLSEKMATDLTAVRFRPNVVISGCSAFAEVHVHHHRPGHGVMNRKEPLQTLKGYRQCKPSERSIYKAAPLFGQMFIVKQTGRLQVGDVVYKIRR